jgi:hypothetical protein
MNSKLTTDFLKPTIITAQQYGTKVSVELDHSDTDIDELFDAFQTLVVGLGYHESAWKGWIVERAAEYQEEEDSKWDEDEIVLHDKVKQSIKDAMAKYNKDSEGYEDQEKLEDEFFGKWDEGTANKRMDVIGQNGNDGLHYDRFEDYQNMNEDENPWGSEEEEDEIKWPKPNNVLIDAKKQYDEQVKMNAKKKTKK